MYVNLGKVSTNDEVIINTENISRIYKKGVNLNNMVSHPFKYSIYMNDGKNLEISLTPSDNRVFLQLLEDIDYKEIDLNNAQIQLF
ncbi:MAG: hypothetical protein MR773_05080 [Eubacterium coprostanoligenes]|uniref:Uncharacterized protein n=1 Tax=Eubacterium coprostanoligenes TaxID=290054 RepID=A0A1T4K0R5_9FIRM|nr:hypothetical protein [Eubacterium coprostanoligenes]MCI6361207.1 hypothetical protein [Eubacterium coprostanoligenes]MDD6665116.1 hypothetical protein [Eubacterium coprostanoligenes]MDD7358214.1 hypothetical protein [Eubacterium coprostanoligenes]MDY4698551.1 hypothetical protein [Eubacterium coprostanoligenes]SJZ35897.1 hypothetical protein SAMN02745114_00216 [Eubacterium coprostanoligenes]